MELQENTNYPINTITIISDTHTKHLQLQYDYPDAFKGGDLIICAGDITSRGDLRDVRDFLEWFSNLPYMYKVFIAGNHDYCFERDKNCIKNLDDAFWGLQGGGFYYLQDDLLEIGGLRIYGSPWQPWFYDWAFNLQRGEEIKKKWDLIPDNLDILITHGPAYGILDTVAGKPYDHLGCEELAKAIERTKPKIHVCGHIHTGNGLYVGEHTRYINASNLNERYNVAYPPRQITL